ncbi:MAG: LuxR C-terminal-related transcriptional regulator [Desulfobacterales bacterium]|jgi:DNA-binding CsgD family transcriptional regulator
MGIDPSSDPLASAVLNSLSAHIAILDAEGVILETNEAWRRYANANNPGERIDAVGTNYLGICDHADGDDADDAIQVAAGIRRVIAGRVREFVYDYPCHAPDGKHWYYMRAIRMIGDDPIRVVVSHEDITALKLTEEALRKSRQEIVEREQSLEEANIALKVLLKQREQDKAELERKVLANVKGLVFPYLEKLRTARLKLRERTLVEIVETHLKDIISPFLQQMANADLVLTPQEMQVAALIRDGKSSKEIASILIVSEATVNFHRKNLREKFGLKNKRVNLRAYLLSMT